MSYIRELCIRRLGRSHVVVNVGNVLGGGGSSESKGRNYPWSKYYSSGLIFLLDCGYGLESTAWTSFKLSASDSSKKLSLTSGTMVVADDGGVTLTNATLKVSGRWASFVNAATMELDAKINQGSSVEIKTANSDINCYKITNATTGNTASSYRTSGDTSFTASKSMNAVAADTLVTYNIRSAGDAYANTIKYETAGATYSAPTASNEITIVVTGTATLYGMRIYNAQSTEEMRTKNYNVSQDRWNIPDGAFITADGDEFLDADGNYFITAD